jgi:hypothetical protein
VPGAGSHQTTFYGPGTYVDGERPPPPRIQIDAAARRTIPALSMSSTVLTIVDDDAA